MSQSTARKPPSHTNGGPNQLAFEKRARAEADKPYIPYVHDIGVTGALTGRAMPKAVPRTGPDLFEDPAAFMRSPTPENARSSRPTTFAALAADTSEMSSTTTPGRLHRDSSLEAEDAVAQALDEDDMEGISTTSVAKKPFFHRTPKQPIFKATPSSAQTSHTPISDPSAAYQSLPSPSRVERSPFNSPSSSRIPISSWRRGASLGPSITAGGSATERSTGIPTPGKALTATKSTKPTSSLANGRRRTRSDEDEDDHEVEMGKNAASPMSRGKPFNSRSSMSTVGGGDGNETRDDDQNEGDTSMYDDAGHDLNIPLDLDDDRFEENENEVSLADTSMAGGEEGGIDSLLDGSGADMTLPEQKLQEETEEEEEEEDTAPVRAFSKKQQLNSSGSRGKRRIPIEEPYEEDEEDEEDDEEEEEEPAIPHAGPSKSKAPARRRSPEVQEQEEYEDQDVDQQQEEGDYDQEQDDQGGEGQWQEEEEEQEEPMVVQKSKKGKERAQPSKPKPRMTKQPPKKQVENRKRLSELSSDSEDEDAGASRRSRRKRCAPLEYWRGEKFIYGRRESGRPVVPIIKEVLRIPKEEPAPLSKSRRGRTASVKPKAKKPKREQWNSDEEDQEHQPMSVDQPELGWDRDTQEHGIVWDYAGKQEIERRIAFPSHLLEPRTTPGDPTGFKFQKVFGDASFVAAGMLEIPVGGEKPSKPTKDNTYLFYVIEGAVTVKIHRTSFTMAPGGQFMVPRGNQYSIHTISERPAKLFFAQARKMAAEEEDFPPPPPSRRSITPKRRSSKGPGK